MGSCPPFGARARPDFAASRARVLRCERGSAARRGSRYCRSGPGLAEGAAAAAAALSGGPPRSCIGLPLLPLVALMLRAANHPGQPPPPPPPPPWIDLCGVRPPSLQLTRGLSCDVDGLRKEGKIRSRPTGLHQLTARGETGVRHGIRSRALAPRLAVRCSWSALAWLFSEADMAWRSTPPPIGLSAAITARQLVPASRARQQAVWVDAAHPASLRGSPTAGRRWMPD